MPELNQPLTLGMRLASQRQQKLTSAAAQEAARNLDLARASFITGGYRRAAILAHLANGLGLPVNRKWQLQVHQDKDIQRLLKERKVKLSRQTSRRGPSQSYLVLA